MVLIVCWYCERGAQVLLFCGKITQLRIGASIKNNKLVLDCIGNFNVGSSFTLTNFSMGKFYVILSFHDVCVRIYRLKRVMFFSNVTFLASTPCTFI